MGFRGKSTKYIYKHCVNPLFRIEKLMNTQDYPVVIVGAGPAGLTAAYELTQRGVKPLVLEASPQVGGIARTEVYKGYRFDIGGHRFYTKVEAVQALWQEVLGEDFMALSFLVC